ncbi:hypothetical protein [Nocardioides perillae]|uniref:Uncharacterized protein n=1 Tax=Nocardioides perillae TaxID=1119534 RepID=A0A7Y9RUE3_9ACTN|nr:hypothetical protein [Nocardioides perillae]NYG54155.1 hypothetical protein [Nocardioides perillae]
MVEPDRPEPADAPDGTGRDDALRRLLADVRVTEPAPPHVVARLDAALAALAAERGAGVDLGPTVQVAGSQTPGRPTPRVPSPGGTPADRTLDHELAARRRRRHGRRRAGLAAAAAVVVAGLGATLVDDLGPLPGAGGDTATSDAAGEAEGGEAGGAASSEAESAPGAAEAPAEDRDLGSTTYAVGGVPALTSAGFDQEVRRVLGTEPPSALVDEQRSGADVVRALQACGLGPAAGDDASLPVTYDGIPALLLVRDDPDRPGGAVLVEVVACADGPAPGGTRTLRTARSERAGPVAP